MQGGFWADVLQTFQILLGTFCVLILGFNFNQRWPRYKWDLSIDRFGFHIYIPIITSIGIAVLLSILLKMVKIGIASAPFGM